MGCTTCSGNPNTWCTQCMPAEDTWVAPVDKLPDVFMGDRDHMYLLPNGDLFILSPDRTRWIKVNGQGGGATYDDTKVINRLKALEGKTDNFISSVNVSRNGNKVKLTYTLVDGTIKEVEFEDKDTVALAYDDTALKARVKALEDKPDNDKQTLTFTEGNRNLSISNGNSVTLPDYLKKDDAYSTFPTYAKLQDEMTKNIKDKHVDLGLDKLFEDKLQNGNNPYVTKGDVPALSGANFFVAKGDIPGTKPTTINKGTVYNSDTIKVGDTVRDRFLERTTGVLGYGYWKVTAVTDTTVTVEPLGTERDITIGQSNQSLTLNGSVLSISDGNSVNLPQYVSPEEFTTLKNEYNQLKGAFEKLLQDLKGSGAWKQTGGTIFEGNLYPDRHIATGNINLFGGTVDGSAFIRTNNGKTENDLAGGIN